MRATLLVPVLFIAIALSGCLGGEPEKKTIPSPGDDVVQYVQKLPPVYISSGEVFEKDFADPSFARVVEVITGSQGGEPTIGVTSKGGIFIAAGSNTIRSLDGGHTWKTVFHFGSPASFPPGTVNDPVRSYDPMLIVDPTTDRVFTNHNFPPLVTSSMITSDDNGETWTHYAYGGGIPINDHQKLGVGTWTSSFPLPRPDLGYPNPVYYCYNNLPTTNCATSFDGGETFAYYTVALGVECGGINGMPVSAKDGTLYVPGGLGCGAPAVAISTDNGLTFTEKHFGDDVGLEELDPAMTVTPDGTAYYMGRGADGREYLWRSKDRFNTVQGPWIVSPPDVKGVNFAAMVSGDNGRVAMVYLGNRESNKEPSETPSDTVWHLFVTWSYDAAAEKPTFQTHQITPPDDPVQIGCIWMQGLNNPCRNLLDFIGAAIDKDGRLHIAFTDGCTERLACANNAKATDKDSRDRAIALAVQDHGPSLLEAKGLLPSLGWTTQVNDLTPKK